MKITNITVENFGPYIGVNSMDFSIENSARKVVLIGGKNGSGKTTLFNVIKIGMYGCRAYGFESNNTQYLDKISKIINKDEKLNKKGTARICISVLMEDGKNDYRYTFERIWKFTTKHIRENCTIFKNNVSMNETEKSDFESYLLQLIPPNMFKFYFFDGESIGNFIFNGIKDTDFKNAFLKLCGLDTMEIIYENFLRISNKRFTDKSSAITDYNEAVKKQNSIKEDIEIASSERTRISNSLNSIDEDLARIEFNYIQRGGISKKELQSMHKQISKEEAHRDSTRKWLKDTANDVLPFVVLHQQLVELKEQIEIESHIQSSIAFKEGLSTPEVKKLLSDTFTKLGIDFAYDLSEKTVAVLMEAVDKRTNDVPILNLSKAEQLELISQINNLLAFDITRIHSATESINTSLNSVKQIRKKLDSSDCSNYDIFLKDKELLLERKNSYIQKLLDIEQNLNNLNRSKVEINEVVLKSKQKYEDYLKAKSVNDISAKALLAFNDLQARLYYKYITEVEHNFSKSFKALINKSNLIDGIKIDEQLQVYPYVLKTFNKSELMRNINQFGEDYIINQFGTIALDALSENMNSELEIITIPIEVKQPLSAGEKQVFIMALYQALSMLNKVSVPYIIDTPFARIDTEHRQNILNKFFMKLKGQIIIFSTDEEIVGEYHESITDVVSNHFLLQNINNNGSEIIDGVYFGGIENDI